MLKCLLSIVFGLFLSVISFAQSESFYIQFSNHEPNFPDHCEDRGYSSRVRLGLRSDSLGISFGEKFPLTFEIYGDATHYRLDTLASPKSIYFIDTYLSTPGQNIIWVKVTLEHQGNLYQDSASFVVGFGSSQCELIEGYTYLDANGNCKRDSAEKPLPNVPVVIGDVLNEPYEPHFIFSDSLGYFSFLIDTSDFRVPRNHVIKGTELSYQNNCRSRYWYPDTNSTHDFGYEDTLQPHFSSPYFWVDSENLAPCEFVEHGHQVSIGIFSQVNFYHHEYWVHFGDGEVSEKRLAFTEFGDNFYHAYSSPGIYHPYLVVDDFVTQQIFPGSAVVISDTCFSTTGKLYFDLNEDGQKQSNEPPASDVLVEATFEGVLRYTQSDSVGNYSFSLPQDVEVKLKIAKSNDLGQFSLLDADSLISNPIKREGINLGAEQDFAISCDTTYNSMVRGAPIGASRPGFNRSIKLKPSIEKCSTPKNGVATLTLSSLETFISAEITPDSIYQNKLFWFFNPTWFEKAGYFTVITKLDSNAQLGSFLCNTFSFFPTGFSEQNADDNVIEICTTISGSYDPNDKTCFVNGVADTSSFFQKGDDFVYRIRFQNTGSDTAFNIYILDTLSEKLDLKTIEILSSSHPMQFYLNNNRTLRFEFNDILLPQQSVNDTGSNGYVFFRILPDTSQLIENEIIPNSASIFFDYNLPILTNTSQMILSSFVSGIDSKTLNPLEALLIPNPAQDEVTIVSNKPSELKHITVMDLSGNTVFSSHEFYEGKINVSHLKAGLYLVSIQTFSGMTTRKLIIH